MRLKSLKLKNLWAVLVIAVVCGWIFSCDDPNNPFKTNLGEKVPIEPPKITVKDPATGSYLNGNVVFTGEAEAYRELKDVKIKVDGVIRTWRSLKDVGGTLTGDKKTKTFTYPLDTSELPDGFLNIQFQVIDPDYVVESVKYLFIVKNGPSEISMTKPDSKDLYTIKNEDGAITITGLNATPVGTGEIYTGSKILGNITDRRGIKPGYPRIKIWNATDSEPPDSDFAQLFLSNVDDTQSSWEYGVLKNLDNEQVQNSVTFAFLLSNYHLVEVDDTQNPGKKKKQIVYEDPTNQQQDLAPGTYRFRIMTSDTFFTEKLGDKNYLHPRQPDPAKNEKEVICYEPPLKADGTPEYGVNYHTIQVVPRSGETTKIEIDNSDVSAEDLRKQPNIYIERESSEKIIVSAIERPTTGDPMKIFRLRINAYRESDIGRATLEWSHPTKGRGFLPWDDIGNLGYVTDKPTTDPDYEKEKATLGHKGENAERGKIFQFTGYNGAEYYNEGGSLVDVFTSSGREYTLTVKVYVSGEPDERTYYVTLDEGGPTVDIVDIKGKSEIPAGSPDAKFKGGTINKSAYTVNDNIQVSQYSFAERNIKTEGGKSVVKWFVEEVTDPLDTDGNAHLAKTGILLEKLREYRSNPTSAASLAFLDSYFINDTKLPTARDQGWVDTDGSFKLSVDTRTAYNADGEKTGTNALNNKYLWLYVVAQDTLSNLGYAVQKLYVDDNGDKPDVKITGLVDTIGDPEKGIPGIATPAALFPGLDGSQNPQRARTNILGRGENIDLSIADDDGIRPWADSNAPPTSDRLISIKLTSPNFPGVEGVVDISKIITRADVFELNDAIILGQSDMASALIAELNKKQNAADILDELYRDGARTFLPDGVYTLVITVPDAMSQKVSGAGLPNPGQGLTTKTIHFAVQEVAPEVKLDIESALEGGFLSAGLTDVTGTVKSRLKISKLTISFSPDVVTNPIVQVGPNSITTSPPKSLMLYYDKNCTQPVATTLPGILTANVTPDEYGYYVYYWKEAGVNFEPAGLFSSTTFDWRRIIMAAWDGAGVSSGNKTETVYIDATAPAVTLYAFNFGRKDYADSDVGKQWNLVNGKVPIEIEANDRNGIGTRTGGGPTIRWFILPGASTVIPTYGSTTIPAGSRNGYFTDAESRGGARYRTIIDTTAGTNALVDGSQYKLYVIALDKAGNEFVATAPLATFQVRQNTDDPRLKSMSPPDGNTMGGGLDLKITGNVFDDDGFDSAKVNTYVEILFPSENRDTGVLTWGTNWLPVEGKIGATPDYLEYTYDFNTSSTRPEYLNYDGEKRYRLRIKDEALRSSAAPDLLGKYYPEGKNPDAYTRVVDANGNVSETYDASKNTIRVAGSGQGIVFPATGSYSFFFKNSNPDIWFNKYDPNDCHRAGHDYDPQHTGSTPSHANVPAVIIPVYPQSGGRASLLADLNAAGPNNKIVDIRLADAYFAFSTVTEKMTLTPNPPAVPTDGKTYTWSVNNAWLAPFDATTLGEGVHSISIQATDTLSNTTVAEWSFAKDIYGPKISFDNISASATSAASTNIRIISGIVRSFTTTGNGTSNTSPVGTGSTRYFTFADHGLTVGDTVRVGTGTTAATRYVLWVDGNNFKLSDGANVWNPAAGNITVTTVPAAITGQFADDYSDIGENFDYRFDTSGWVTNYNIVNNNGAIKGNTATWMVPIDAGGAYNNTAFPDGQHTFSIRAKDKWWVTTQTTRNHLSSIGDGVATSPTDPNSSPNSIYFVIDRKEPQIITKADGSDAATRMIVANGPTNGNGYLAANQRVFSGANAKGSGNANNTTRVFTLRGLVYEHNLNTLRVNFRNGATAVGSAVTLTGINASAVAWKNTTAPTNPWFGNGTAGSDANYPGVNTVGANLRVRRAAVGDFGLASTTAPAGTPFRYVWELDVRVQDFNALITAIDDDGVTRNIAITARDLANYDSDTELWPFFLDGSGPEIEFSNISTTATDILDDIGNITLKGSASDSTPVQKIQYRIWKKNDYSKADSDDTGWTSKTGADFKDYNIAGTEKRVMWNIDDIRTFTTTARGTNNTNPVGGNANTNYFTSAGHGLVVGDTVTVDGIRRYVLYVNGNNFKLSDTYTMTNPVTGSNVWNPAAGNITVTASALAGDGYYRVQIRAYDWSLGTVQAGGNPTTTPYVYFYIDRADPVIGWGDLQERKYDKWDTNDEISFTINVSDVNTFVATNPVGYFYSASANRNSPIGTVAFTGMNLNAATNTVTVTVKASTRPQGMHTLELVIKDKAGRTASEDQYLQINLDNTKPTISMAPPPAEAIAGRVDFRGSFTKSAARSPVTRVAFRVTTESLTDASVTDISDTWLRNNNWVFNTNINDNSNNAWRLWVKAKTDASDPQPGITVGTISNTAPATPTIGAYWTTLMEIQDGDNTRAVLRLYDTRRFTSIKNAVPASTLLGNSAAAGSGITFNGINVASEGNDVYGDNRVNQLLIYLLAIDEAGNHTVAPFDYYVYPAGDVPKVTLTNPDETVALANRQLNGTIKIQGRADDNYRVSNVWFRVLRARAGAAGGGSVPPGYEIATFSRVSQWDASWEPAKNANDTLKYQTAVSQTFEYRNSSGVIQPKETSTGWYRASIGDISKNVPAWYAQINANGELEPVSPDTSRSIIIQTIAEDTIWDDTLDGYALGGYTSTAETAYTTNNLFSVMKQVYATVVKDQPTFVDEEVRSAASGSGDTINVWGSMNTTAVTGRAAYRVIVKHNAALGAIRWTNAPSGVPGTAVDNLLNGKRGDVTASYGIEASAAPNPAHLITGAATLLASKTYLIWTPFTTPPTGTVSAADNVKNTVFKPTADVANNGASLLEMQADGTFEWLVIIDMDTDKLGYTGKSDYYNINLEAHDNSKTVALFSRRTAAIPIDNLPPSGVYTQSTNVAGNKASFGGEAGDSGTNADGSDATVKGVSRVVMWLSRDKGDGQVSIVWDEKAYTPSTNPKLTFNNGYTGTAPVAADIKNWAGRNAQYSGVTLPNIPAFDLVGGSNNSCVVIDRQDPLGNQAHHGHQLEMGWAATGGALDNSWYVVLDSTMIESGRITAHYIVYDRAGNATYYNQRLMVLNGVARISSITLATDIYGSFPASNTHNGTNGNNSPLQLQTAHTTWTGTGNLKFGSGTNLITANTTNGNAINASAISQIKTRYETNMGMTDTDERTYTDSEKGVSQEIPIDTSKPGVYSVVFDEKDFAVRNNLFAVKVDTLVQVSSREKDRYYRVEYVSGAVAKTGTATLTSTANGIRAGRVYIINAPGTNFPWGVLGAQTAPGETFQRGLVFLALQDGSELDLVLGVNGYGNPSVWELNSDYYRSTTQPLTRTVPGPLQFNTGDVMYSRLTGTQTPANTDIGKTAEFVYRNAAFGATAGSTIRDFTPSLDSLGRPNAYDPALPANASQLPYEAHSLFIIKVFDGPESDLFGDFALLSVRVNNNDATPPYAQLYDLNPKTEGVDPARTRDEALAPGVEGEIGANRTKGGLYNTTGNVTDIEKSGHIEPRTGTSLTNTQMGGQSTGTINRPAVTANAYFTVDTVSGEVIVRGYAEDNQRISRVDLEFYNTTANPTRQALRTILVRDTANSKTMLTPTDGSIVKFTEKVELDRHRVEWAYLWNSEEYPGASLVVGDIRVRAVAYNTNKDITPEAPHVNVENSNTTNTSATITHPVTSNRTRYDSFNPDFPASTGNFYRYNDVRINLRPYITGFLRNSGAEFAHNIRSRQGWYILRRGESAVVTGFNLRNPATGTATTNIILPGTGTTRVNIATSTPTAAQGPNYGLDGAGVSTRHRLFTVPASTANTQVFTGNGLVTMTVGGVPAVNTGNDGNTGNTNNGSERWIQTGTTDGVSWARPRAIQPWNAEWTRGEGDKSKLWDDFTQVHIWQSNEAGRDTALGDVDRARFARGAFNISYPSMSIDPTNGRLWASHQEGGRKPTQTGGSLYPGGGAYISNNSSTYPYENTDTAAFTGTTEGLRQVGAFSEHMTYTNMYVDNSSRVWAIANSITKYNAADRWRFLPGMWLWGPVSTYDNYNGNPRISHFPRTTGTNNLDTTYHWFPFPNTGNGLTGMYAVESLWYNGGNNSRSIAEPQSTEQFHNPHVVAYTPATGTQHVHVSYYDSKDGSLKYRYNVVGTTGVVDTSASPRRWVNLDGGADVDDNSSYNEDQGQASAGNVNNVSYIGNYPAESAVNPNGTGSTGVQVNSPYAGGTSYTLTEAGGSTGNLTAVYVQNGSYVALNQNIYRIGGTDIKAPKKGFIVLNFRAATNDTVNGNNTIFRIYDNAAAGTSRIVGGATRMDGARINAGKHNAIAVTSNGFPVIAYYDETNQSLKIAVSNNAAPTLASNWTIRTASEIFTGDNASYAKGTGEYVSIQIDTRANQNNRFHIAAMNAISKNVVYISGTLGATANSFAVDAVQVVDSVGNVGAWCKLSLTSTGEPWIVYMDDGYKGSRDGAKVAYRSAARYNKGAATFAGQDVDLFGKPISGWEAMHVPTRYRVENAELGMERFPTIRVPGATRSAGFATFAAVGFLGEDYYRIAYYVE